MNGIIPFNKNSGELSRRAGAAAARLYGEKKHGHAGTLDPLASGVLPVLLGAATRLIPYLPDEKAYRATMRFGLVTDTGDIAGTVISRSDIRPSKTEFEAVLPRFTGTILQTPPLYSALKKDGRPLYDYARKGEAVEVKARPATVTQITLEAFSEDEAVLYVACKSGTYIRTLAEDIARACGAQATLTALVRTRTCGISLENCRTLAQLEAGERPLISAETLFNARPAAEVAQSGLIYLKNGGVINAARWSRPPEGIFRAYSPAGEFLGLAEEREDGAGLVWQNREETE